MYKLSILTFAICCAVVLTAVSAYPSYPVAGDYVGPYKAEETSPERLRVVREAAADPAAEAARRRGGSSFAGSKASSSSNSQSFSGPHGSFSSSNSQSSSSSFSKSRG